MSVFCIIDDKYVPIYRVMWISAIPHFCGSPECQHEGDYEIRLEQGESVWATQQERDAAIEAVAVWESDLPDSDLRDEGEVE